MVGDNKWLKHVETLSEEEQELWEEIYKWNVEKGWMFIDYERHKAKHYFSIKDKIIECEDCGFHFKVPMKDTKSCRCPSCQWERDKELTRARVRKYREKKNNTN